MIPEAVRTRSLSRRRLISGFAGIVGLGATVSLAGCAPAGKPELVPSDDEAQAAATVRAFDNAYDPPEVEITANQAVRWDFSGPAEHDVVADDGSFVSALQTEGSYTHVFTEPGEYPYDCSVHPEMTGVVRVRAATP
ncbi:cupredoxin domain-containing protein [Leucobacter sp. 7(1)]|uniref:cupredoxin domain-containing protein n=1 Tax=Leucobacter sp. 7(1) TaxID=1255613 RepID=UPI000B361025|nr:cupredoxin domain-containing protein [Leucobacter sp. 7(1)]